MTSKPFTAKDARALTKQTPEEMVEAADEAIKSAAMCGKYTIVLRGAQWSRPAYDNEPQWVAACKILTQRGFKVKMFYEERQFVDIGTEISWAALEG